MIARTALCGATVTVMTSDGGEALVAASHPEIRALADLEFTLGEGPTSDAFATRRPVLVPELGDDRAWVVFSPAARGLGVTGVYAFPLGVGAVRLGVLTCYAEEHQALDRDALNHCLSLADAVTQLLLTSTDGGRASDPKVRDSLEIRSEVYQAQGMLSVALGVPLGDALARLRSIAFAEDLDINDLATELVAGRRPFPEREDSA